MKKFFLLLNVIAFISCSSKQKIDLLVYNATIYTVDSTFSTAEAMAVKEGKIIEVGKTTDLQNKYDAKEKLDAQGKSIYPGFIDAHAHFVGYGNSLQRVNLVGTESWEDVIHHVADFAKGLDTTAWILGRGWDQNDWAVKNFPDNKKLNELFPDRPVMLTRIDGHAAIANDKALELAGVKPGQKINGGEIETQNGKLTGILVDNATSLVSSKIPAQTLAEQKEALMD